MDIIKPSSMAIPVKRRWWSVIALSAAAFVDSSEDYSLSILWVNMYKSLGLQISQLGSFLGVSSLIRTLTLPFWGYAADRFSRKTLLVGITGIWGLWTLMVAFVHNYFQLMSVRIISSLGLCVLWPTAFSLLSDLFPSKERGRAAGVMTAVSFTGSIASFGILPALAAVSPEGWRNGFIALGLASVATGLFMLVLNDPPRGSSESELSGIAEKSAEKFVFRLADLPALAKIRSWWVLLFQNSIDAVALSILYGWIFTWLNGLGLGDKAFIIVVILAVGNLTGHLSFGWLGDILDARYPSYGRVTMACIGLVVTIPALAGLIALGGRGVPFLMIFGMLAGLGLSSVDTGARWPIAQGILLPEIRATGRAVLDMAIGIVGSLAMTLSTSLVEHYGVATMMLLLIPIPKLIGALTWIPLYWTYPFDRAAIHKKLIDRRETMVGSEKPHE